MSDEFAERRTVVQLLVLEGESGVHDRALRQDQRVARLNAEHLGVALLVERREFAAQLVVELRVAGPQGQAVIPNRRLVGGEYGVGIARLHQPQAGEVADAARAVEIEQGGRAILAAVAIAVVVGAELAAEQRAGRRLDGHVRRADRGAGLHHRLHRRAAALFEQDQAALER